jgi:hypothetical protein
VGSLIALSAFAQPPEDANYAPSVSAALEHHGDRCGGDAEDANCAR